MIYGSQKSRILSGISANVFGQTIMIGVQLAIVPLLLYYWGTQYYGEWLLLFSLPAYLGMSDLGLGTVATTEMSLCIARKDYERARQVFRGAFFCIMAIGLIVCVGFSISAWLLPYHEWLHLQQVSPHELHLAMTLLTVYIFLAIFLTLLLGAYRTIGRYGRGQVIAYLFRLLEFSALLVAVAYGCGVVGAATAYLSVRLLYAGFVWMDIRKRAVWLRLGKFNWEWQTIRRLLPSSLSMMTVHVGQNITTQGLVTITGIILGAKSVVLFSTVRTLCNFAKQVIGIINLSVFSEYAISIGNQDINAIRRLHMHSVQAIIALSLISVVGLRLFGAFVLELWTKNKVTAEEPFFTLYLCYIFVNSLWLGSWNMLLGCNRHQSITHYYVLLSAIVLTVAYFGIDKFGLGLLPVVMMLTDAVIAMLVLRKSLEVLEQTPAEFLRQILTWPRLKFIER